MPNQVRIIHIDDRVEDVALTSIKLMERFRVSEHVEIKETTLFLAADPDEFAADESHLLQSALRDRGVTGATIRMDCAATETDPNSINEAVNMPPDPGRGRTLYVDAPLQLIEDIVNEVNRSRTRTVVLVDVRLTGFSSEAIERAGIPSSAFSSLGLWIATKILDRIERAEVAIAVYTRTPAMDADVGLNSGLRVISKEDPEELLRFVEMVARVGPAMFDDENRPFAPALDRAEDTIDLLTRILTIGRKVVAAVRGK